MIQVNERDVKRMRMAGSLTKVKGVASQKWLREGLLGFLAESEVLITILRELKKKTHF